jgi:hypothetical protein
MDPCDDFHDVPTSVQCIGKDRKNRDVIFMNGHVWNETIDVERLIGYTMKIMEKYRCKPFVILFSFPIDSSSGNQMIFEEVFELLIAR